MKFDFNFLENAEGLNPELVKFLDGRVPRESLEVHPVTLVYREVIDRVEYDTCETRTYYKFGISKESLYCEICSGLQYIAVCDKVSAGVVMYWDCEGQGECVGVKVRGEYMRGYPKSGRSKVWVKKDKVVMKVINWDGTSDMEYFF